jgi:hypothetical protein
MCPNYQRLTCFQLQQAEVDVVMSLIDLQGVLDREFQVGFYYSPKASRGRLRERWPETPEENIERLGNAGLPYDRKMPKCNNCDGKFWLLLQWSRIC